MEIKNNKSFDIFKQEKLADFQEKSISQITKREDSLYTCIDSKKFTLRSFFSDHYGKSVTFATFLATNKLNWDISTPYILTRSELQRSDDIKIESNYEYKKLAATLIVTNSINLRHWDYTPEKNRSTI